nr:MAG TPA: hypothetical protein [Bacteriophage sp.]
MRDLLTAELVDRETHICLLGREDVKIRLDSAISEECHRALIGILNLVVCADEVFDKRICFCTSKLARVDVGNTNDIARVTHAQPHIPVVLRLVTVILAAILVEQGLPTIILIPKSCTRPLGENSIDGILPVTNKPQRGQGVTRAACVDDLICPNAILRCLAVVVGRKPRELRRRDLFVSIEEGRRHLLVHRLLIGYVLRKSPCVVIAVDLHQLLINLCKGFHATAGEGFCLALGLAGLRALVDDTPCHIRQFCTDKRRLHRLLVALLERHHVKNTVRFALQLDDLLMRELSLRTETRCPILQSYAITHVLFLQFLILTVRKKYICRRRLCSGLSVRRIVLLQKMTDALQERLYRRMIRSTGFNQGVHGIVATECVHSDLCRRKVLRGIQPLLGAFVHPLVFDLFRLPLLLHHNVRMHLEQAVRLFLRHPCFLCNGRKRFFLLIRDCQTFWKIELIHIGNNRLLLLKAKRIFRGCFLLPIGRIVRRCKRSLLRRCGRCALPALRVSIRRLVHVLIPPFFFDAHGASCIPAQAHPRIRSQIQCGGCSVESHRQPSAVHWQICPRARSLLCSVDLRSRGQALPKQNDALPDAA